MAEIYGIVLTEWDDHKAGWRLDLLRLPGTKVEKVFSKGKTLDEKCYSVDGSTLRWSGKTEHPQEI